MNTFNEMMCTIHQRETPSVFTRTYLIMTLKPYLLFIVIAVIHVEQMVRIWLRHTSERNSMLHMKLIDWEVWLIIFSLLYFKLLQVFLTVCGKLWCSVRWHSEVGKGGWTGHGSRSAVYPAKIKNETNLPAEENEKGKTSFMESK